MLEFSGANMGFSGTNMAFLGPNMKQISGANMGMAWYPHYPSTSISFRLDVTEVTVTVTKTKLSKNTFTCLCLAECSSCHLKIAEPHTSVGSIPDLRTGGCWFDPRLSHYTFRGLMIGYLSFNYANLHAVSPMIYHFWYTTDIFRTKTDIPRIFLENECTFCG